MSDDAEFRCPVCRARQTLRKECRRCQADLRLVERAHHRVAYLIAQQRQAQAHGNLQREQVVTAELQRLAPTRRG